MIVCGRIFQKHSNIKNKKSVIFRLTLSCVWSYDNPQRLNCFLEDKKSPLPDWLQ